VGAAFLTLSAGQAAGAPLIGLLGDLTDPRVAFLAAAAMALLGLLLGPRDRAATYNFGVRSLSGVSSVPPERESRVGCA
jgi:hypothetical protein